MKNFKRLAAVAVSSLALGAGSLALAPSAVAAPAPQVDATAAALPGAPLPAAVPATPRVTPFTRPQNAVNFAYAQLGDRYGWGATGPNAWDCSGLTYGSWRYAGRAIPRTSYSQWSNLRRVSLRSISPGDIVIYRGGGHVGIYVGKGYIIHASTYSRPVAKVRLYSMSITAVVRPPY